VTTIRRSLSLKLVLAFLLVSVTGVVLSALLARWATYREFERLVVERNREEFVGRVTAYYDDNGSWEGILQYMRRRTQPLPQAPPVPQPGERTLAFVLVDTDGRVLLPAGPFQPGEAAPVELIADGVSIEVEGEQVGTVVTIGELPELDRRDQSYLDRTNRVSLYAALGATVLALVLGVLLARTLTHPIRALTGATRAVAAGDLDQEVTVRSRDELGELAASFNQMSADLARATEARRQMTADIAHELRTPLTVVGGYLESMRDGVLQPTHERFETMYAESQHLLRLVEDLRTLSLADAGELTLNKTEVPARALIQRVAVVYQLPAEQHGVDLVIDVPGYLPDLAVDPDRMQQVLGNLVSNALRYTPEGGRITLAASAQGSVIRLSVADTGAGIPAEALPRVFDRFYRVDTSRSSQETEATPGDSPMSYAPATESGLGLAIARSIVEAHGGRIDVASEVSVGTTFAITLPV